MSQSSTETKDPIDNLPEDDPLAELARIVNAGSVFGSASAPQTPEKTVPAVETPQTPEVREPAADAMVPAAEAYEVSTAPLDDLDAALGAQLEAELVNELHVEPEVDEPLSPAPPPQAEIPVQVNEPVDTQLSEVERATEEMLANELGSSFAEPEAIPETPVFAEPAQQVDAAPELAPEVTAEPDFDLDLDAFEAEIANAVSADGGFPSVEFEQPEASAEAAVAATSVMEQAQTPVLEETMPAFAEEAAPVSPVGDVDPLQNIQFEDENEEFVFEQEEQKSSNWKGYFAIAAVLLVAFVGGAGAYFTGAFDGGSDGPLVVEAEDDPVRVEPDDPGGKQIPNQDRTVYETIAGDEKPEDQTPALVDRSEEPVIQLGNQDQPRVILPGPNDDDTVRATVPPQGPRTVRTVIVKPDGTVVEGDEPTASAPETAEPSVPTSIVASNTTPVTEQPSGDDLTPRTVTTETLENVTTPAEPEAVQEETPAAETEPEAVQVASLPPIPRPNTERNRRSQPVAAAQPEPDASAPQTAAPSAGNGNFMVQLSSQRSRDAAASTFRTMQRRYTALAGYSPDFQRADLGDRGIYHRVRVGPFERGEANSLCTRVKSQGGDCIVRRR